MDLTVFVNSSLCRELLIFSVQVSELPKNVEAEPMEVSVLAEESLEEGDIEDIDREDENNPQLVVEYVRDIYNYLRHVEAIQSVKSDYLAGQQVLLHLDIYIDVPVPVYLFVTLTVAVPGYGTVLDVPTFVGLVRILHRYRTRYRYINKLVRKKK